MAKTTGLSGNEIYCLAKKGYTPGNIVVGNSVHSLGLLRSLGSGLKAMIGGEIDQVTKLIEEGRETAYNRMMEETDTHQAVGLTGVTSELIFHGNNIEFLSIGSTLHSQKSHEKRFSTAADGQELYAQLDANYQPLCFAFGNVAYSIGLGGGFVGGLKTLARGEIKEYSDIFNHTRHLALERIAAHGEKAGANAILGIQTTILPFGGVNEMLMIGTASYNETLNQERDAMDIAVTSMDKIVTSDMTNIEMWNMANLGYAPMRLLLGTSVYSLGLIGGISAVLKSFVRGEISELTKLIYDARENALGLINEEAKAIGADDVVGVKTYVYQLGNGLIEFLAIGTAVKKLPNIKTVSDQLPPQAVVADKDTFYDTNMSTVRVNANRGGKPINKAGIWQVGFSFLIIAAVILWQVFGQGNTH